MAKYEILYRPDCLASITIEADSIDEAIVELDNTCYEEMFNICYDELFQLYCDCADLDSFKIEGAYDEDGNYIDIDALI